GRHKRLSRDWSSDVCSSDLSKSCARRVCSRAVVSQKRTPTSSGGTSRRHAVADRSRIRKSSNRWSATSRTPFGRSRAPTPRSERAPGDRGLLLWSRHEQRADHRSRVPLPGSPGRSGGQAGPHLEPEPALQRLRRGGHPQPPRVGGGLHHQDGRRQRRREGHEVALLRPRLPLHAGRRSEEHTSELQSREKLVCRLLLEKKNP